MTEETLSPVVLECRIIELVACLRAVAAGIWRDPERNTCGLAGGSAVVHEIERILKKYPK